MVRGVGRRGKCWPLRRTTVAVCCLNLLALLYVIRALYTSIYVFSSSSSAVAYASSGFGFFPAVEFSEDQIERMKESIRLRRAAEPGELARLVNRLKNEFSRKGGDSGLPMLTKQKLADEILQMLKALEPQAYVSEQQEALESWRKEKLEGVRRANANSSIGRKDASVLERALEVNWHMLLEEIGLLMPIKVSNKKVDAKQFKLEEAVDAPVRCHPETHTEYEGVAVKSGSAHLEETAAGCCKACVDQAKGARDGEMKCNIWIYCASKDGCHSSLANEHKHKHKECLLKQAERPRVKFKDTYPEAYRDSHQNVPLIVPWVSGFVG